MADEKKILLNGGVIAYYTGRRVEGERQYKTACGCCCFELAIQASKRGCGIGDAFSALYVQPNESGTPSMTRYKTLTQTVTCGNEEEPRSCSGVWTHEEATGDQNNGCRLTFFRSVQTASAGPPSYANDGGFLCVDPENIHASCGASWEFTADNLSEEINYSEAEQWALSNFYATASSGDFYTPEAYASISTAGVYAYLGPRAIIEGSTHYRIRYKPSPTGYLKVWLGRRRRIIKYAEDGGSAEYQTEIDIDSVVLQHKPIKPCNGEYLYSKIFSTGDLILIGGIIKPQYSLYSKHQDIYIIAYSFVEGYNPTKNWSPTDQYNLERNGFPDPKYAPPTLNPF
jgi:hypothetical protein